MDLKFFAILTLSFLVSSTTVHGENSTTSDILRGIFRRISTLTRQYPDLVGVEQTFPESKGLSVIKNKTKEVNERIVFGSLAKNEQFPFVGLALAYTDFGTALCSCSLVTPDFVVYAAHCIDFQGLLGAQFFFGSIDSLSFPTFRNGIAYAKHPSYNTFGCYNNDIAVFQLESPIELSANIGTVRLPGSISQHLNYQDTTVTAIGFGTDETGSISRFLKFTQLQVTSGIQCFTNFILTLSPNLICAKSSDASGICFGDSGVTIQPI